jgi:hypothetical protein
MKVGIQWTRNLSCIYPCIINIEILREHLITDCSSKLGKSPNAHKHKEYMAQLFKVKDKVVTQVVVKANVLKGTEKFFLFKSVVHASMKKEN